MTDLPVAVLYILGITALGVYGIVLGGWSSGSTYPLLGAVRSTAQVISYELAMSLALVSVFLWSGSMSTSQIVNAQAGTWWAFTLLPAFVIYIISMLGETNRLPFDLPEAEGELVGGFHTEYSSMKFAWFFLAEYINMLNVSAVATTLFLGGYRAPLGIGLINDGMFDQGWWGVLWFLAKLWLLMAFFVWVRGTLLRFRYDQFMNFGWKVLIPAGLVTVVFYAVLKGLSTGADPLLSFGGDFLTIEWRQLLLGVVGGLVVIAVIMLLFPGEDTEKPAAAPSAARARSGGKPAVRSGTKSGTKPGTKPGGKAVAKRPKVEAEPFDAFAGGYPVPPLPGQQLPPSPRKARITTPAAASVSESGAGEDSK